MSLLEAVIAAAIVTTIAAGVAHLLTWARHEAWAAGVRSTAVLLAIQKMEQLRSLDWYTDSTGTRVSDEATNLAEDPPGPAGRGLQPSPGGSLDQNVAGLVDYVDADGRPCGTGTQVPPCAAYVRRWAVEPFGADPEDTRLLVVRVLPVAEAFRERPTRAVRLQTVRTRVAR
jgi:hypothetical protein